MHKICSELKNALFAPKAANVARQARFHLGAPFSPNLVKFSKNGGIPPNLVKFSKND